MSAADAAAVAAALLADPATTDAALAALVARADVDPALLGALAEDAVRLGRSPALAVAIYLSPRASLSVANRAVLTCHRAGAAPDEIPGFEELARAIAADPAALDPASADPVFVRLLDGAPEAAPDDAPEAAPDGAPEATPDGAPQVAAPAAAAPASSPGKRRSVVIDFSKLKLYEKIRLATLGNAYCRQNLLRDSNRMVAMAAIRSPQLTDGEVIKAAGNRALSEDVIRYIANRKELVKQYAVKVALVGNVKCPLAVALRLLPTLHGEDVKQLARSKNIPGALSVAAKRLAATRGPQ